MVNIRQIPFYRDKKVNKLLPRFLIEDDDLLLAEMISKFQRAIFDEEDNLIKETFLDNFDDYKLGMCIFETLQLEFYPYSYIIPERIDEIVEYRLQFWRFINEEFKGFVFDSKSRESALQRFQNILPLKYSDMSTTQINDMIFQDYLSKRKRIVSSSPPNPLEVRKSVNNHILKTIFRNSQRVIIRIKKYINLESDQVKKLFFLSKRFGIFSTIMKTDEGGLEIFITGPEELIGRKEKYGGKIFELFNMFVQQKNINLETDEWELIIEIPWRKRNRIINIDFSAFRDFFTDNQDIEKSMDFDSRTEEIFYRILTNLYPWKVSREPIVLIENNQIFIPDFSISFGEYPPIYIEIIGFWTEDYKIKKINKLTELSKGGLNTLKLVLIADKKLNFPNIKPFIKFEYTNNDYNSILSPLNRYLKINHLELYEQQKLRELKKDLSGKINHLFTMKNKTGIISEDSLLKYLELFNRNNLRGVFIDDKLRNDLKENGWRFIPRVGLIKRILLNKWRKSIFMKFSERKKNSLDIKDLSPIFPEDLPEGNVPLLLEHFGFKIQYQQLEKIIVYLPSKKMYRD